MLDGVDALVALARFGTVSEAATRLRLTQSAVSKRLQALEAQVGVRLVEPDGRRLRLTAAGLAFVERARPLVAELRGLARSAPAAGAGSFRLALADSIASSWGPEAVRAAIGGTGDVRLELHAHRSVLVIESVRLGRYDLGLCTEVAEARDLVQDPLVEEPLALVHSGFASRPGRDLPLLAIEPTAATWRAVEPALRDRHARLLAGRIVTVESFAAVLQMARAGFGNGLVPLGIVRALEPGGAGFTLLPGVARRIALFSRKSVYQLPAYAPLRASLAAACLKACPGGRRPRP
jgi:DNA-binding transcriptional LysR family regulator